MNELTGQRHSVGFIGAGNISRSLISGLIDSGWHPDQIRVSDPDPDQLSRVTAKHPVLTGHDNAKTADFADVLILAVKPQIMAQVSRPMAVVLQRHKPLVMTVAAGIGVDPLDKWLGGDMAIVRVMPNTPALLGYGASGAFANASVTHTQKALADKILNAVGIVRWVDREQDIDAVTAISGSGPAYFFYLMEAMENTATQLGLDAQLARDLIAQTAIGAAYMMRDSGKPPGTLRDNVTSPGGTTLAAMQVCDRADTHSVLQQAVLAAHERALEMAQDFSND